MKKISDYLVKICSQCKIEKGLDQFSKSARSFFGFRSACKECTKKSMEVYMSIPEIRARQNARSNAKQIKDRKENPQKYRKRELKRDREKTLAISRAWYARNIEEQRVRMLKYSKENRALARKRSMQRHVAKFSATPQWLTAIQEAQIQEFYDLAEARDMQTGVKHHVDHIFPLRGKGFNGLHVPWNLQILTSTQNIAKKNKIPAEYANLFWNGR